jgi:hypothetical protein
MMRQVLLTTCVMCMTAHLVCFELQCHCNELNILQKLSGVKPSIMD